MNQSTPPSSSRRGSLRRKFLLVVMLATASALLLSAMALLVYEVRIHRDGWINDLTSQARLLAQSAAPALSFDDPKSAEAALKSLALRPQVELAAVYDAEGKVFARYIADGREVPSLPAAAPMPGVRFDGDQLELSQRLEQDGELLGWIYLRAHHDLWQRVLDYAWIMVLTSAAGLGLAALIFRRLHPTITGPILAVAEASRQVMQRNYDVRVSASSDDEVGELVTAFNKMLGELSAEMRERHAAEEALRTADQRKDEFLATLAHELRNPLAPLSSALAIFKMADDPQVRQKTMAVMERQLAQMVRLIDDLLEVSRITQGKLQLRRAVTEVQAIARSALEAAQPMMGQREHRVTTDMPIVPIWVDADAARLTQVFVNLLHNAAKYTEPRGLIALNIRLEGDQVAIEVRDSGIGIEPEQQQLIFEMFTQLDNSLGRGAAGLGVGLTIARQLVAMHGGSLSVKSDGAGKGTTFTVLLPTFSRPTSIPVPAVHLATSVEPNSAEMKVLVADDNVDFADSFATLLRMEGQEVHVAHDGLQALETIEAERPKVAFLDIGMPGMDGYQLATALRARSHLQPLLLVAVTGWGQESDKLRVKQAGFDHHLVKPVDLAKAMELMRAFKP